jgi:hypothetical protein
MMDPYLSFFGTIDKIMDQVFLGVPLGSSFGKSFLDSDVRLLESIIIPKLQLDNRGTYNVVLREEREKKHSMLKREDSLNHVVRKLNSLNKTLLSHLDMVTSPCDPLLSYFRKRPSIQSH